MAITPDTATEIDSYQGNPALAIGQSGNLPFFPTMSPEVINSFTKITDDYVAKKQKDYDQWQQNVANKSKEVSTTIGAFDLDMPELRKQRLDLKQFIAKNPDVFAVGAENTPKYDEFLQKENAFLTNYELSKRHAQLDNEYKRLLTKSEFQNPVAQAQYKQWRETPISERASVILQPDNSKDLYMLKKNLTNYKDFGETETSVLLDDKGNPTGRYQDKIPYEIAVERLLPDLIRADGGYSNALYQSLPESQRGGKTEEQWVEDRLLEGIPLKGYNKPTTHLDPRVRAEISQDNWEERNAITQQQKTYAQEQKDEEQPQKLKDKELKDLRSKVGYIFTEAEKPMSVELKPETKIDLTKLKLDSIPA